MWKSLPSCDGTRGKKNPKTNKPLLNFLDLKATVKSLLIFHLTSARKLLLSLLCCPVFTWWRAKNSRLILLWPSNGESSGAKYNYFPSPLISHELQAAAESQTRIWLFGFPEEQRLLKSEKCLNLILLRNKCSRMILICGSFLPKHLLCFYFLYEENV